MHLLKEFSLNDKCSYLDNLEQTTHYQIIDNCDSAHCQDLIERGYRRFGKMYFRPICSGCNECQSIKIDVNNFTFSKSARRVIKKATSIKSYIQIPTISQAHLNLFEKYHKYMSKSKGWEYQKTSAQNYHNSFVNGHNGFGHEILYFDGDRLIGVDLIDILEDGLSSIYFYYDPDYMHLSLGRLSLYFQIKFAKETNKNWIYLGYYVQDCPSLSYKAQYTPFKTLQGRPTINEAFEWL